MFVNNKTGALARLIAHDADVAFDVAGKRHVLTSFEFFSTHREATPAEMGATRPRGEKHRSAAKPAAPKPKSLRRPKGGKGTRTAAAKAPTPKAADKPPAAKPNAAGGEPAK